jgi:hypothetical protein
LWWWRVFLFNHHLREIYWCWLLLRGFHWIKKIKSFY